MCCRTAWQPCMSTGEGCLHLVSQCGPPARRWLPGTIDVGPWFSATSLMYTKAFTTRPAVCVFDRAVAAALLGLRQPDPVQHSSGTGCGCQSAPGWLRTARPEQLMQRRLLVVPMPATVPRHGVLIILRHPGLELNLPP